MPLKVVSRRGTSILYLRGTVRGISLFESTRTDRPDRAEEIRAKREAELFTESVYGARAVVTFAAAAESYIRAEPRSPGTLAFIRKLTILFHDRVVSRLAQTDLDLAYQRLLRPDASPATKLRNVLTPYRAILEHAARRGWCDRPALEVPRQPRPRVAYLLPEEATRLVHAAAPHLRPLLVFLIGTGARMSEALELDWTDVDLTAGRALFRRTKTDLERRVDLVPTVRAALASISGREGRVFRPVYPVRKRPKETGQQWKVGEGYRDANRQGGGQIKTAWSAAWRRAGLPGEVKEWTSAAGVARKTFSPSMSPHKLRHTWATWHWAIHKDLVALKEAGGWQDLTALQIYTNALPEAYVEGAAAWLGVDGDAGIKRRIRA